jgi:cytochrome bd-type quinol oxidase subunit 2
MEKQKYAKICKILLWVLIAISVAVLIWGSLTGFEANNGAATDVLFYWAYAVLAIALIAVICVGIVVRAKTDVKSLASIGIILVGACVLFGIAYLLASGAPAIGYSGPVPPTASELKMTDTILNLAYIVGACAILSIVVAEVVMAIRNKK